MYLTRWLLILNLSKSYGKEINESKWSKKEVEWNQWKLLQRWHTFYEITETIHGESVHFWNGEMGQPLITKAAVIH